MSSSPKVDLRVAWCSRKAAKYACEHYHYSRTYVASKNVPLGVWEDGQFIGAVVFGWGANLSIGSPYGLEMTQVAELVRVALRQHQTPVSRILRIARKKLKQNSPGLRLLVSYADPVQEHIGGIYQAGNWVFVGQTHPSWEYRLNGRRLQRRAYTGVGFDRRRMKLPAGAIKVKVPGKYKYLYPLDAEMAELTARLAKPYPKKCPASSGGAAPPDQGGEGGSTPTVGL